MRQQTIFGDNKIENFQFCRFHSQIYLAIYPRYYILFLQYVRDILFKMKLKAHGDICGNPAFAKARRMWNSPINPVFVTTVAMPAPSGLLAVHPISCQADFLL
jgi:hypothetical protein